MAFFHVQVLYFSHFIVEYKQYSNSKQLTSIEIGQVVGILNEFMRYRGNSTYYVSSE